MMRIVRATIPKWPIFQVSEWLEFTHKSDIYLCLGDLTSCLRLKIIDPYFGKVGELKWLAMCRPCDETETATSCNIAFFRQNSSTCQNQEWYVGNMWVKIRFQKMVAFSCVPSPHFPAPGRPRAWAENPRSTVPASSSSAGGLDSATSCRTTISRENCVHENGIHLYMLHRNMPCGKCKN